MKRNAVFFKQLIFCLPLLLSFSKAYAGILDVNAVGVTFHPFEVKPERIPRMPRRLDKKARCVVTPGFVVGYDFRAPDKKRGKSLYVMTSYSRDCFDWPFFLLGCGMRYRFNFLTRYTFDVNVLGTFVSTKRKLCEDWDYPFRFRIPDTRTKLMLVPVIAMGLQCQVSKTETIGVVCVFNVHAFVTSISFSHTFSRRKGVAQVSE